MAYVLHLIYTEYQSLHWWYELQIWLHNFLLIILYWETFNCEINKNWQIYKKNDITIKNKKSGRI